jgi:hypothetical protein
MISTDNFSIPSEGDYATTVILILAFIFYLNRKSIKEYVIKNFEKFTLVYGYILVIGISLLLLGFVSTFEIVKEGFEISRDDYMNDVLKEGRDGYCRILKTSSDTFEAKCNPAGDTSFRSTMIIDANPPEHIKLLLNTTNVLHGYILIILK